jgi:hypothetical protein
MCRVGFYIMPVEGAGWPVLRTYIGFHLVMGILPIIINAQHFILCKFVHARMLLSKII